jgi:translation initiation factor eIF-2B subunit alpha/methylthioribose-1-phosphate isomerase
MKVIIDGIIKEMQSVWMEDGNVKFIDQRQLPHEVEIFCARDPEEVAFAIRHMIVRGAPAIGVAAAYGVAQAGIQNRDLKQASNLIRSTRPTAQDLFTGVDFMLERIKAGNDPKMAASEYVNAVLDSCRKIGEAGESLINNGHKILTHCNAGALATVDFGTALAPIRLAFGKGKYIFVYVDETRPRLQGARLTAWELFSEGIPCALIADNASGHFMQRGDIDIVIVGADRITQNGDTANKIGTYEKAVLARENGIPFYVAAPLTTFDFSIMDGRAIPIEERSEDEVLNFTGKMIAPSNIKARNPAFDVTPARYITAYITEYGVVDNKAIPDLKKHAIS